MRPIRDMPSAPNSTLSGSSIQLMLAVAEFFVESRPAAPLADACFSRKYTFINVARCCASSLRQDISRLEWRSDFEILNAPSPRIVASEILSRGERNAVVECARSSG
jgi:hypothetical protein